VTLLCVLLGGAAGAVLRYLTDRAVQRRFDPVFPWGTFIVNVAGSLVLGVLSGLTAAHPGLPGWVRALAGVGFCGALTTYSTFGLETVLLAQGGGRAYASINAGATLVVGLGAVTAGWWLGSSV